MGAVSYKVKVRGEIWKRHADQLQRYRGPPATKPMAPISGGGESEVIKIPDSRPLLPLATTREPAEGGVEVGESTEETTTTASESNQSCRPEGAYKEQGSGQSSVRASSRIASEVSGEGAVPEPPVSPTSAIATPSAVATPRTEIPRKTYPAHSRSKPDRYKPTLH